MKKTTFWSALLGVFLFTSASILGGFQIPGYDPISQYISESYATGVPYGSYLQIAFIASGVFLAIFGFKAPAFLPNSRSIRTLFFLLAIFYGLGTVVTGIFPCDTGCKLDPVHPTVSQFIHNFSGSLTYMVVPFCLIGLGISFRKWPATKRLSTISLVCGILSLAFVVLLFGNPEGALRGLYQRTIESAILFWLVYCAFFLRKTDKLSE